MKRIATAFVVSLALTTTHASRSAAAPTSAFGVVSTIAGAAKPGFADGQGIAARFNGLFGVAVDQDGTVYLSDAFNNRIRKVTKGAMVSTLAGTGKAGFADGPASVAQFSAVQGLGVDGNRSVYVADPHNNRIRKIDRFGNVSTVAGTGEEGYLDGPRSAARFFGPTGIAVDRSGILYVGDNLNYRIRKVDREGNVTTHAGSGLTILSDGSGVSGFADGPGVNAQFRNPTAVALDRKGNLYVADYNNCRVRRIDRARRVTTLVAPPGGCGVPEDPARDGVFSKPIDIETDTAGNVFVAENFQIKMITTTAKVVTVAGSQQSGHVDGPAAAAKFGVIAAIALDPTERFLYVADENTLRRIELPKAQR